MTTLAAELADLKRRHRESDARMAALMAASSADQIAIPPAAIQQAAEHITTYYGPAEQDAVNTYLNCIIHRLPNGHPAEALLVALRDGCPSPLTPETTS